MPSRHEIGSDGERKAAEYLASQGFTVLFRNYRTRHGEIDIVAMDGDQLVFVEVKTRTHPLANPESAVGSRKLSALARAAHCYLADISDPERGFRLDLVVIHAGEIRHHRDLFGF
jgi:putative endonuclease